MHITNKISSVVLHEAEVTQIICILFLSNFAANPSVVRFFILLLKHGLSNHFHMTLIRGLTVVMEVFHRMKNDNRDKVLSFEKKQKFEVKFARVNHHVTIEILCWTVLVTIILEHFFLMLFATGAQFNLAFSTFIIKLLYSTYHYHVLVCETGQGVSLASCIAAKRRAIFNLLPYHIQRFTKRHGSYTLAPFLPPSQHTLAF